MPVQEETWPLVCGHCGSKELFEVQTTRQVVLATGMSEWGFETTPAGEEDVLSLDYECADCGRELDEETLVRG